MGAGCYERREEKCAMADAEIVFLDAVLLIAVEMYLADISFVSDYNSLLALLLATHAQLDILLLHFTLKFTTPPLSHRLTLSLDFSPHSLHILTHSRTFPHTLTFSLILSLSVLISSPSRTAVLTGDRRAGQAEHGPAQSVDLLVLRAHEAWHAVHVRAPPGLQCARDGAARRRPRRVLPDVGVSQWCDAGKTRHYFLLCDQLANWRVFIFNLVGFDCACN